MSVVRNGVLGGVLILFGGAALAQSSTLDLHLNGDAVRASYLTPLTNKGTDLDLGILHNEDDGDLAEVGFHINGLAGRGNAMFDVALGGRVAYVDSRLGDGMGLGIGARIRYSIPSLEQLRLGVDAHYTPKSASLGDLEGLLDLSFRAGYQVHDRALVYLLVSSVRADFDRGDTKIDRGLHLGLTVWF